MRRFLLVCAIVLWGVGHAQSDLFSVGDWDAHLSYRNVEFIEPAGDRVYAAGPGGFFYYDKEERRSVPIDKSDGLSELGVSSLHYVEHLDVLIIGYSNGNIDLLYNGNEIFNINNLKNSSIQGEKNINDISSSGDNAYLSGGFGIVNIDLVDREIKETYKNIGQGGEQIEVYQTICHGDTLYANSENGLQKAMIDGSSNLLDYENWFLYTLDGVTRYVGIRAMEIYNDTLIFYRRTGGLFYVLGDKAIQVQVNNIGKEIREIEVGLGSAFISYIDSTVYRMEYIGDSLHVYGDSSYYKFHQDFAIVDSTFWFGHISNGLTEEKVGGGRKNYYPNGLATNAYFRLYVYEDLIACTAGGYNNGYVQSNEPASISFLNNGRSWNGFSEKINRYWPKLIDHAVSYTFNPQHQTHYIGTFNGGLITWDGDTTYHVLNDTNSILNSSLDDKVWVKVPGLFTDQYNNTWISNHQPNGGDQIFKIPADTTQPWESFLINNSMASWIVDLVVEEDGNLWCLVGGPGKIGGMMYFNPETGQYRYLSDAVNAGGLPSKNVRDFTLDRDGNVWMGTAEGVAVFRNVDEILDGGAYEAELPIFEGRPLLQDETVTSVAVDGGNRKWFGTTNGVFLFNEDASEILATFNENNSPLLSNRISDIVVNDLTGEVFFATDKGVSSFWSDATAAGDVHSEIKIFPNPALSDFEGVVSIQGLAQDANVKITDASGTLVKELDAEGGMATWDLLDIDNRRVQTGLYLFFSISEDGNDAYVGKLVVVD